MRRRVHLPAVLALVVCLLLTFAVAAVTLGVRDDAERQLLRERTGEAAAVLSTAVNGVQVPLAGAAQLAGTTDGAPAPFEAVLGRAIDARQFTGGALVDAADASVVTRVGDELVVDDGGFAAVVEQALGAEGLAVIDTLDRPGRRLGYAYATPPGADGRRFVVYAESALPEQRYGAPRPAGAFEELEYALFLGPGRDPDDLLYASMTSLRDSYPAVATVDFGDRELVLATDTDAALGGWLLHQLPWLLAAGGVVFAGLAAVVTEWLTRRRVAAESLAHDVSRLYDEQAARARTLQRSLIPRSLDVPDGMEVTARYWPADVDDEVGGDFYDLFVLGDDRWGVTIGDVCGKGIDAAALTALTRHTIRAAARHLSSPAAVLRWTHEAIHADHADTYATASFGFLTRTADGWQLELALGGHPPPLLLHDDGSVEPIGHPGTVLGIVEPRLTATSHVLRAGDTLVLHTDGLTDAPGAGAVGSDELLGFVAAASGQGVEALADGLGAAVRGRRPDGTGDDMALLVLHVEALAGDARHAAALDRVGEGVP